MKTLCNCGCGKIVDINTTEKPVPYKITKYTNGEDPEPLEVMRLTDNVKFKLGDTIKRITLNGKKHKRFVLYKIRDTKFGLILDGYVIDSTGSVIIDNNEPFINSNQNPNIFKTLYK